FNLSGNQLILTTGVLNLTWTGSGGSTWNINSTSNWTDGTSSYKFLNGYAVNFTDSPGANQIISVGTTVQPSTVTFSNTNRSYTFEDLGDGKIQTNTLTKNGSGQVRFNLPLEVSGTMTLNAGATVLTSPDSAPSAADITATLAGGGTLELAAGYLNPLTLNADNSAFSGNLVVSREEVRIAGSAAVENAFIVGSGGLTGAASITKDGGGTLHLATVNSHQGATTIVNGTLRATAVGSLPASSTVVFGGPGSDQAATVLQLPAAMVADETVAAAPLSLNPAAADSTAILRKSSSGPLARITGQASLNGRSLHVAGGGVHLAGVIAGTGNLVIDLPAGEAVRISNSGNSFAGNIIVNGGSFRNAAADCIPDGAAVTLAAGATFEVGANEAVEQILGPATSTLRPSGGAVDLTVGASGSSFTYSGSLADNGINNVLNLNKAGSGTLTLDGTSTSAGRLRVQQGKVYVNGAIASRIEIAADAILAGTGTIHFNSQGAGLWPINGRIAPGRADAIGTFNLNNALSFQAGAGMDIRIADWSGAAPGTTHDLLLCPQMIFGGGNFVLRVDGTGMTGFTEAPRSFVIATATQQVFAPGINVQQFIATNFPGTGTWRITANGTNLLLNYTPPAGFGSWIGKYPSLTGDNALAGADPDSDGQDNLLEYVFDSAPDAAVPRHVPTGEVLAGNFVFTYRRNDLSLTDTSQTVQWSTDLQTWNDIPIPATSAGVVTIIGNDAEPDTVSVAIPRNGAPRITARLKVVQSEL
ncbi:MAG: autotransporter-associated beta strand repeat-containing protein, partial [Akkermansiaceae bacterium]|nr:autotransporter-associated beta strand repeat-containing protein [Akkermansiaceae bacterium]